MCAHARKDALAKVWWYQTMGITWRSNDLVEWKIVKSNEGILCHSSQYSHNIFKMRKQYHWQYNIFRIFDICKTAYRYFSAPVYALIKWMLKFSSKLFWKFSSLSCTFIFLIIMTGDEKKSQNNYFHFEQLCGGIFVS